MMPLIRLKVCYVSAVFNFKISYFGSLGCVLNNSKRISFPILEAATRERQRVLRADCVIRTGVRQLSE